MANRGACLHDGTLSVSRFDFGKRPGAPAERQVAFTPVQAAEADVGQAAAPQTLEKSLGLLLTERRHVETGFVQRLPSARYPHEQHENGVRSCRTRLELQFRSRRGHTTLHTRSRDQEVVNDGIVPSRRNVTRSERRVNVFVGRVTSQSHLI